MTVRVFVGVGRGVGLALLVGGVAGVEHHQLHVADEHLRAVGAVAGRRAASADVNELEVVGAVAGDRVHEVGQLVGGVGRQVDAVDGQAVDADGGIAHTAGEGYAGDLRAGGQAGDHDLLGHLADGLAADGVIDHGEGRGELEAVHVDAVGHLQVSHQNHLHRGHMVREVRPPDQVITVSASWGSVKKSPWLDRAETELTPPSVVVR